MIKTIFSSFGDFKYVPIKNFVGMCIISNNKPLYTPTFVYRSKDMGIGLIKKGIQHERFFVTKLINKLVS